MELTDLVWPATCEDLEDITDNFSKDNYIGKFQFGEIYRGKSCIDVYTVKTFDTQNSDKMFNAAKLRDELLLLQHNVIARHEGMVRLSGYCKFHDKFSLIYELKSLDTLHHLMPKDNFTWLNRVKVALRIACLLKFLHGHNPDKLRFQLRNLNAAHIMLDEDYNPKLLDFSRISGGIFPNRSIMNSPVASGLSKRKKHLACRDYGWRVEDCDVFAFGILLLMLISKKACTEEESVICDISFLQQWVNKQFKPEADDKLSDWPGYSLVHNSLEEEPVFCSEDGPKITKLAIDCLGIDPSKLPTMKEVVDCLRNLQVVKHNASSII